MVSGFIDVALRLRATSPLDRVAFMAAWSEFTQAADSYVAGPNDEDALANLRAMKDQPA